jgi:hypothetical protein
VNDRLHEPVASSVQAAGLGNVPVPGEALKSTTPPGVPSGTVSVSVTVAVQFVAAPVAGDDGEHATAVVVPSIAANADAGRPRTPIARRSNPSRRSRVTVTYSGIRS